VKTLATPEDLAVFQPVLGTGLPNLEMS